MFGVKSLSIIIMISTFIFQQCAYAPISKIEVPRITKEELKSMLGNPNLIILDVRGNLDWNESPWKIKGAIREDYKEDDYSWVKKYPKERTIVLYCN